MRFPCNLELGMTVIRHGPIQCEVKTKGMSQIYATRTMGQPEETDSHQPNDHPADGNETQNRVLDKTTKNMATAR